MAGSQKLIDEIASTLAAWVKAYNIPAVASAFGLATGDEGEAYRSKRMYVEKRLIGWSRDCLLELAKKIEEVYPSDSLQAAIEEIDPTQPYRISAITRQHLLARLDDLPPVGGKLGIVEFMERLWSIKSMRASGFDPRCATAYDEICQHMVRNHDYSFRQLLELLQLTDMSNRKLVQVLEQAVHPLVRADAEQQQFVEALNTHLKPDGLALVACEQISGHCIYRVLPLVGGVSGRAKNLIFASNGPKPEIVLSDAINNDIQIVKHEQHCLVYDVPLAADGLLWKHLIAWWRQRQGLPEDGDAERHLYRRLRESLASDAERLVFRTYFKEYRSRLGAQLPALVPQVYLHYDPYTMAQLRGHRRLPRQRMDFLLLLSPFERIVIEVDGKHHYSDGDLASASRYAELVRSDRDLRLLGYEVYRFGGAELIVDSGEQTVRRFFDALFHRRGVRSASSTPSASDDAEAPT